ncbi:hypothetical protein BH20BAC1_BH20BAC1_21850 [soil metagenome]
MRTLRPDSVTTLQTIAGGAVIKQGTTIFKSDSAVINSTTHVVEAFGHVHINQADSVQTYADYLKYLGVEKTAYLRRNVRLTDKKGTLLTEDLDYNLQTGIGNYHNGGKVLDRGNTITSKEGTYYSDTKDVYFRNEVRVTGPKNRIKADSLIYNMQSEVVAFTGNTNIKNDEADINTTKGTYDLKTSDAFFTSRTTVKDSSGRVYVANNIALDDKSGNAQLEGNALIRDSANGVIVIANQIFLDKGNKSFLATRKPGMIIINKNDSTWVAGDTLFSGITTRLKDSLSSVQSKVLDSTDSSLDSLVQKAIPPVVDTVTRFNKMIDSIISIKRSEVKNLPVDSLKTGPGIRDSGFIGQVDKLKTDSIITDPELLPPSPVDSSLIKHISDSSLVIRKPIDTTANQDSSVRYFIAFHHVRVFNDSLQSTCDSLFFSARDSVFRLFQEPVVWSAANQVTGDTIFLFTKDRKADRMYVFEKGIIVNKTREGFFNQIAGKTINGYFTDGSIDYMRVKGSQSESVYYAQDDDSAYVGMNRASGDVIDLYFKNDDLIKVLFVNDVKGKMYPMREVPKEERFLKNFIWLEEKRPKDEYELFE